MYKCGSTCYNFNNGHICKHIHRVHSLLQLKQPLHKQIGPKQPLDEQTGPTENKHTIDDFGEAQYDNEDDKPMNMVYADSAPDSYKGMQTNSIYLYNYLL